MLHHMYIACLFCTSFHKYGIYKHVFKKKLCLEIVFGTCSVHILESFVKWVK